MDLFLHVPTLLAVGAIVGVCISASLILMWATHHKLACALTWAVSYFGASLAMVLLLARGISADFVTLYVTNAVLLVSFGVNWYGFRQFFGTARRSDLVWAFAGCAVYVLAAVAGPVAGNVNVRVGVTAGIVCAYLVALLVTLHRGAVTEPLPAMPLAAVLYVMHAAVQVARVARAVMDPSDPWLPQLAIDTFTRLHLLEAVVFALFCGILQITMIGQQAERRFRRAAETDDLTGLNNRRRFLDVVDFRLAQRPDKGALIIFDIDHFKRINDTAGHLAGDAALVAFARAVGELTRRTDVLARIGGEEFALYLSGASRGEAAYFAARVCRRIRHLRFEFAGRPLPMTVSAGVAAVEDVGCNHEDLHRAADAALYSAKRNGRDQTVTYAPPAETRVVAHPAFADSI